MTTRRRTPKLVLLGLCAQKRTGKSTVAAYLTQNHAFVELAFADCVKRYLRDVFFLPEDHLWGPSELREVEIETAGKPAYWTKVHEAIDQHAPSFRALFGEHCTDPVPSLHLLCGSLAKLGSTLTIRHLLQQFATGWGKALWPEVWVQQTFSDLAHLRQGGWRYEPTRGLVAAEGASAQHCFVISDTRYPDDEAKAVVRQGGQLWWIDAKLRVPLNTDPKRHSSEPTLEKFEDAGFELMVIDNNKSLDRLYASIEAQFEAPYG